MASTDALKEVGLNPDHVPDLETLVEEAGWNQTEDDWRWILANGRGFGMVEASGRLVASAVTLRYGGDIGWIGMVIVAKRWRRRGIARSLVETCVADLSLDGFIPGLDATPDGERVYGQMGFVGGMALTRWRRQGNGQPVATPPERAPVDCPTWVVRLDAVAFGADREALIDRYCTSNSLKTSAQCAFLAERPGRTARHIGPICSDDASTALDLLQEAIGASPEPLLIDVPDHQQSVTRLLAAQGFVRERPFRRMFHGMPRIPDDPSPLYAIAGPELG